MTILPGKTHLELQTSDMSSKAIKHPFNTTLLVFADFFSVNAHHI